MTHRLDKLSSFMKRCDLITGKLHVKFAIFLYSYFILFFCGIPWNNFITVHVYFPNNINVCGTENVKPRICETSKREFTKQWNYFRRNVITKYRLTYFILTFRSVNILFGFYILKSVSAVIVRRKWKQNTAEVHIPLNTASNYTNQILRTIKPRSSSLNNFLLLRNTWWKSPAITGIYPVELVSFSWTNLNIITGLGFSVGEHPFCFDLTGFNRFSRNFARGRFAEGGRKEKFRGTFALPKTSPRVH